MEFHALTLSFIFALKLPSAAYGNKLLPHMPNVCAEQELAMVGRWQPRVQAFSRLVKVWKPGCGGQPWCMGYERRTVYYMENKQIYSMQYQTVYKCCSGWSQLGGESGCRYPVCNFGVCFNGGNCVEGALHICHCPAGFQGPCCQYGLIFYNVWGKKKPF
ncbi:multiple epidermal growth factor-like domains protein 6 isoform X3 [Heteronotia binoei]|uniref:multiple epidermal growth factor-like domains protein 6 isoform X3 n=1 Tax=Heteronotia binoei TaxID=13085 RepID=UPI0029319E91|nr:multiple epidermal growth factor-like domains protein 6 isoform X3 [Heteronotia binoei]